VDTFVYDQFRLLKQDENVVKEFDITKQRSFHKIKVRKEEGIEKSTKRKVFHPGCP
jgi:hypothetical protein